MTDCRNDNCCQSNDSGFLFGMIIGAIIGAFVAIYLYKNKKSQVFNNLQEKLQDYFKNLIPQSSKTVKKTKKKTITKKIPVTEKIPVILPHEVIQKTNSTKVSTTNKPRKMFKK